MRNWFLVLDQSRVGSASRHTPARQRPSAWNGEMFTGSFKFFTEILENSISHANPTDHVIRNYLTERVGTSARASGIPRQANGIAVDDQAR